MNLADLDPCAAASKGAALRLKNPLTQAELMDAKGDPVTLRLLGRDAPSMKAAQKDIERLKAAGEIDDQEAGVRLLVACIVGWAGIQDSEGVDFPYNQENARKLVEAPETEWVAEQIVPFSLSRRNFAGNLPPKG